MQRNIEYCLPLLVAAVFLLKASLTEASIHPRSTGVSFVPRPSNLQYGVNKKKLGQSLCPLGGSIQNCGPGLDVILSLRAGEIEEEEESDAETDDEETEVESEEGVQEEEEDDNVYDDYDEYDVEEEVDAPKVEETDATSIQTEVEYDEPLQAPASMQIGTTIAVIMLCRGNDLYQPKVVRIARFAFIAYMILMQIFLAYVRIKARMADDRTPVTLSNPLSSLVQSQLNQSGGNTGGDMVKDLASQFLSSKSTVYEYDLTQIKAMNSSLLFIMVFMWILHFKMNQIPPLFIQTATGLLNLFYSPLFQVYVLGRNLERPFKNPKLKALQEGAEAAEAAEAAANTIDDSVEEEYDASATEDEAAEPVVEDDKEDDGYDAEDYDSDEDDVVEEETDDEGEDEVDDE